MKTYVIHRQSNGRVTARVMKKMSAGEDWYDLHHVVYHSPDGFNVGYAGSGPADLALSILVDLLDVSHELAEEVGTGSINFQGAASPESSRALAAFRLHQPFKEEFLQVKVPAGRDFKLNGDYLAEWVDGQRDAEDGSL